MPIRQTGLTTFIRVCADHRQIFQCLYSVRPQNNYFIMKVLGVIFCIYMFLHTPSKTPEITPRTKFFQTPKHLVKTGFLYPIQNLIVSLITF